MIIFIGLVVISFIIYFSLYARKYYENSNKILYNLNMLKKYENQLNYKVLYSSLFLYYNNDEITQLLHKIKNLIKKIDNNDFFKNHYKESYKEFVKYKQEFLKKEHLIFEYMRFNLPLKNSLIYLANSLRFIDLNEELKKPVMNILSSVFLAKSAIDIDFIKNIKLEGLQKLAVSENSFNRAFYFNLKVFLKYFPKYQTYLKRISYAPTVLSLDNTFDKFVEEVKNDLKVFDILSILLVVFVSILIIILTSLVISLDEKVKRISLLIETDSLTGLGNRYKFKQDIKKFLSPAVILFNIDKFKNINDFFSNQVGDLILKKVGDSLIDFFKNIDENVKVYRVGADDFAVILDKTKYKNAEIEKIAQKTIEKIEKKEFSFENSSITVSLSAGIATSSPFLENADIALKAVKKDIKEKVSVFKEQMNEDVRYNIKKSKEIKEAIENNRIIAYYQPIVDKNKKPIKYEVLCRVVLNDGSVKSICEYLDILKENKMYHKVTDAILRSSLKKLEENSTLNLSINLSVEDVMNKEINKFIRDNFTKKNIANRVTFEILESEIKNYDILKSFIEELKQYGIKFAIDDFGRGYSNFSRILKLKIDYLKIDGSLIKDLDKDNNSKLIVETIVLFAKKSNIQTVAEFVHSKVIFDMTKDMGIDYFQGFYLGEPKFKI